MNNASPNLSTAVCVIAILSAFLWMQSDDAAAEAEADEQDRAAITSREWAGRQVCGPKAEPEWRGDELTCLRVVDEVYVAGRTL